MTLTIMLAAEDASRVRAALSLALARSALGGQVRIYAHERAVGMLVAASRPDDDSAALAAAGLPDRLALLAMAVESDVGLIACQTGLALTGHGISDLVDGVEVGGLVGVLGGADSQNLVAF